MEEDDPKYLSVRFFTPAGGAKPPSVNLQILVFGAGLFCLLLDLLFAVSVPGSPFNPTWFKFDIPVLAILWFLAAISEDYPRVPRLIMVFLTGVLMLAVVALLILSAVRGHRLLTQWPFLLPDAGFLGVVFLASLRQFSDLRKVQLTLFRRSG